jgi:hypothetical protein
MVVDFVSAKVDLEKIDNFFCKLAEVHLFVMAVDLFIAKVYLLETENFFCKLAKSWFVCTVF